MSRKQNSFNNINKYSDIIDIDALNINNNINKHVNTNIISKNYVWNNYNVAICYTPNDNIYINIISNSTYQNFDNFIRQNDISNGITLDIFYIMLTKAFEMEKDFDITCKFDFNSVEFSLNATLHGFFSISQIFTLNEKILSGDKILTTKLTELETKYQKKITQLETKIDELENEEIIFAYQNTAGTFGKFFSLKIKTTYINFTTVDYNRVWLGNYMDLNKFKQVEKIIMFSYQFKYQRTINYNHGNIFLDDLLNIFDTQQIYLPSVNELEIHFKTETVIPNNYLRSLPNLKKISFINYGNTALGTFDFIKNTTKLEHVIYKNCLNIQNLDQIKIWFDSKNLKLEIN